MVKPSDKKKRKSGTEGAGTGRSSGGRRLSQSVGKGRREDGRDVAEIQLKRRKGTEQREDVKKNEDEETAGSGACLLYTSDAADE